jgi:hypothetical protein
MKTQCKNCLPKEGIEVPAFTQIQKKQLFNLTLESSIKTVEILIKTYNFTHRDAKFIVSHINLKYGKCNRCNFDELDKEYVNCPKCKALNLNWKL